MPDINLLPWREALREERKRQFIGVICGVTVLALLVGYLMEFRIGGAIQAQNARNAVLQQGIGELNVAIAEIRSLRDQRADMIDRMNVIKNLQANRPEIVRLFDQFVRAMPDGTYVTEVRLAGSAISLEGKAESNNRVSALMRSLDASAKFSSPNLTRVDADSALGPQGSSFTMTVAVNLPDPEEGAN